MKQKIQKIIDRLEKENFYLVNTKDLISDLKEAIKEDDKVKNMKEMESAVEWLINQLTPSISLQQKHINEYKNYAKEIEKELIIETFKVAQVLHTLGNELRAEQYYYNLPFNVDKPHRSNK